MFKKLIFIFGTITIVFAVYCKENLLKSNNIIKIEGFQRSINFRGDEAVGAETVLSIASDGEEVNGVYQLENKSHAGIPNEFPFFVEPEVCNGSGLSTSSRLGNESNLQTFTLLANPAYPNKTSIKKVEWKSRSIRPIFGDKLTLHMPENHIIINCEVTYVTTSIEKEPTKREVMPQKFLIQFCAALKNNTLIIDCSNTIEGGCSKSINAIQGLPPGIIAIFP